MLTDQKKTLKKNISGIGEIKVDVLQVGKEWYLKQIEDFVTNSDEKFYALANVKPELKIPIHFQRALQHFINHIQAGGEEQAANLIRSHFRNWINKQNGSLKYIISEHGQPNTESTKQSVREGVQTEFTRRYGTGG